MKIYSQILNLASPVSQKFYVSPNSRFQFAVKLVKNGVPSDLSFSVKDDLGSDLEPGEIFDGYTPFDAVSTTPGEKRYSVEVENGQVFEIIQKTTDSTVFEVGGEGGSPTPIGNFVRSVNSELPVNGNVDVAQLKITDGFVTGDTIMGSLSQIEDELDDKANLTDITPEAPSTDSDESALAGAKATAEFVNSSINALAAFYITKDADGTQFATKAELDAGPYYNAGNPRQPTQNDYAIVASDETHDNATTRYIWQGDSFEYQYMINRTPLTQAQLNALNSGITSAKVADIQSASELAASTIVLAGEYEDGGQFSFELYKKA